MAEPVTMAVEDSNSIPCEDSNMSMGDSIVSSVENTLDVPSVAVPSTPKSAVRLMSRFLTEDTRHRRTEAKDVIEYEWPVKSGDKWFIQEQIGELLDIKSFSRKFPDLYRRKIDPNERDWLISTHKLNEVLNETQLRDLCAMRTLDINDLMAAEYPGTYQEYQRATAERLKAIMQEQAKEMEAIKNDSNRLAELRAAAIKSASDYNREFQHMKAKHFWDIQTSIIQSSKNKWKKTPAEKTRPGPYPVAVILGQYQNYYKKFSPSEMRRLPLGTVMDSASMYPVCREASPPPINVSERDLQRMEKIAQMQQHAPQEAPKEATPVRKSSANGVEKGKCQSCGGIASSGERLLRCAGCPMQAHPECLDMTDEMINAVFSYAWNCIDCKRCTVCSTTDNEDSILFCDRCDRGYHTTCVGLKEAPKGEFICDNYCAPDLKKIQAQTPRRLGGRRGSQAV